MGFEALQTIVDSYTDLSEAQREKVLMRATQICQRNDQQGFREQYDVVAELVEKHRQQYHVPFFDSYAPTAPSPCDPEDKEDSNGQTNPNIQCDLEEEERREELFEALRGQVPVQELSVFRSILEGKQLGSLTDRQRIGSTIELIRSRLQFLVRRYAPDGQLRVPENVALVGTALHGKSGRTNWTPEQEAAILSSYVTSERNAAQASQNLVFCSAATVSDYWRAAGFPMRKGGSYLPDSAVSKIMKAYESVGNNSVASSQLVGHAPGTVLRYWKKAGLPTRTIPRLNEEDKRRICDTHKKSGGNASRCRRMLGTFCEQTILRYWEENGLSATSDFSGLSPEEVQQVKATYTTSGGRAFLAQRQLDFNCSVHTILDWWRKLGLEIRKPGSSTPLSKEEIEKIVASYHMCQGNARKAARLCKRSRTCITHHWIDAGLLPETPHQKKLQQHSGATGT